LYHYGVANCRTLVGFIFLQKKIQNFLPWVHSSKCAGAGGSCIKKFDISF
jgi:hypothetical protein